MYLQIIVYTFDHIKHVREFTFTVEHCLYLMGFNA